MRLLNLIAFAFALPFITVNAAAAATVNAIDSGWYRSDGVHIATNESFLLGQYGSEHRAFWAFDLSGLTGTATSATLRLDAGSISSDGAFETIALVNVSTAIATLLAGGDNDAAFDDLADGTTYAVRNVLTSEANTDIDIALNSDAIAEINAASGLFAIGGYSQSLNSTVTFDYVFAGSPGTRQLIVETVAAPVPVPAGLPLLVAGLGLLGLASRSKSWLRAAL